MQSITSSCSTFKIHLELYDLSPSPPVPACSMQSLTIAADSQQVSLLLPCLLLWCARHMALRTHHSFPQTPNPLISEDYSKSPYNILTTRPRSIALSLLSRTSPATTMPSSSRSRHYTSKQVFAYAEQTPTSEPLHLLFSLLDTLHHNTL